MSNNIGWGQGEFNNDLGWGQGEFLPQNGGGGGDLTGLKGFHSLVKLSSGQSTVACNGSVGTGGTFESAGKIVLYPYIPNYDLTSQSLSINVRTALASSFSRILIFDDLNGKPNNKIFESADLICSTTGIKTVITSQLFAAGTTYWIGTHASSTQTLNFISNTLPISYVNTFAYYSYTATVAMGTLGTTIPSAILSSDVPRLILINI